MTTLQKEGRRVVDMIMLLSLCRLDILFLAPPNAHLQDSRLNMISDMISDMRLKMAVHESWASLARKRDGICTWAYGRIVPIHIRILQTIDPEMANAISSVIRYRLSEYYMERHTHVLLASYESRPWG